MTKTNQTTKEPEPEKGPYGEKKRPHIDEEEEERDKKRHRHD